MRPGSSFALEVNPRLPLELVRLRELASDLWYSWHRPARELFSRMHPQLWDEVGHNPTMFLRYVDESRLLHAVQDPQFMACYAQVFAAYDAYRGDTAPRLDPASWRKNGPIAYFCAEFGLHESLPIYSGGLGILAGDHCKAASDMRLPLVAVGLLYRQGYFAQTIDRDGTQIVTYNDTHFTHLPATPVMSGGDELRVRVELPGRSIVLRVWHVRAGHVNLYFLDADVPPNSGEDRGITYRLYGGDRAIRLEQELVLGVGGVRALAAVGIQPAVWHINEGHAAFLVLERARVLVKQGVAFPTALETVAGNTVFTTHTAVPAGHDQFEDGLIERYFAEFCRDTGLELAQLLALGRTGGGAAFNMTALAVRGSRFHNAVSRIHGSVSSNMLRDFWPQVPPEENPITHVTNAVHVPTFFAPEWGPVFERYVGTDWYQKLQEHGELEHVLDIPDDVFWSVHQSLKSQMLHLVRHRVSAMHLRNHSSETHLARILRNVNPSDPSVLTIGFARRFATYKRAGLLLVDLEWLSNIVVKSGRPVVFVFAGKAHPADAPGQDVIREIARIARLPEFEDKLLLVEGYDLHVARRLVSGVDVWLNNPVYPLEASGTSGMKAGMNGVLNLSVLDGWWDEAYQPGNGWAIKPVSVELDTDSRNREEARALYETLQDRVIPLYYTRGPNGYSNQWIRMAKQAMATLLPQYGATRMVRDYARRLYTPAAQQHARYADTRGTLAAQLTAWKARVRSAWAQVSVSSPTPSAVDRMAYGERLQLEVAVRLGSLDPADVRVELLLDKPGREGVRAGEQCERFAPIGNRDGDAQRYAIAIAPQFCGHLYYYVRVYPYHESLAHPFEMGLMVWA